MSQMLTDCISPGCSNAVKITQKKISFNVAFLRESLPIVRQITITVNIVTVSISGGLYRPYVSIERSDLHDTCIYTHNVPGTLLHTLAVIPSLTFRL